MPCAHPWMTKLPRVAIEFCTRCKWNLRAAWYLQELLSTFGTELGEVALIPGDAGVFRVTVETPAAHVVWDRKEKNGFPDSKELKQLVRDIINPAKNLGHSEKSGGLQGGAAAAAGSAACDC